MLSFDQIQCELKAVIEFDALFLASADCYPDELDDHECRVPQDRIAGISETDRGA
jgi:hypothetical protein